MNAAEKLERALQDEWEFHGEPNELCKILREEVLKLRKERSMTDAEQEVADMLADFWNAYIALPPVSESEVITENDLSEVERLVNSIHNIIAYRVARRCNPESWV